MPETPAVTADVRACSTAPCGHKNEAFWTHRRMRPLTVACQGQARATSSCASVRGQAVRSLSVSRLTNRGHIACDISPILCVCCRRLTTKFTGAYAPVRCVPSASGAASCQGSVSQRGPARWPVRAAAAGFGWPVPGRRPLAAGAVARHWAVLGLAGPVPWSRVSAGIGKRRSGQRPQCHREAGGRSGDYDAPAGVQERQAAATGDGDGVAEDSDAAD